MSYKVGIINLVRDELKEDLWGTMRRLAELGYQGFEGDIIVGETPEETKDNRKRMSDLGMEIVALPCSHNTPDRLDRQIENAHLLGASMIVTYFGPAESEEQVLRDAERLEKMAVRCASEGVEYCYHNHEHEFRPQFALKNRVCSFDLLYNNTEKLRFELDIAWCHFGGMDPVRLLRRIGHRVPILHVKDLDDDNIRGYFTAVGLGVVNCFGAMEAAAAKGCKWMVVEQDAPKNLTRWETAVASIYNIRESGLLPARP